MYQSRNAKKSIMNVNESYEGESLEQKIRRIVSNKEPISDGAPLVYTERKDGVQPQYDVRTDRFEIAIDAMDKVSKSHRAKRESKVETKDLGAEAKEGMKKEGESGGQTVQATDN